MANAVHATQDQVYAALKPILGIEQSAGSSIDEDVKIGNIVIDKRYNEHFTTAKTLTVMKNEEDNFSAVFDIDVRKLVRFYNLGVHTRNQNFAYTGRIAVKFDVARGKVMYVVEGSMEVVGGDGPAAAPIIAFIQSKNGKNL